MHEYGKSMGYSAISDSFAQVISLLMLLMSARSDLLKGLSAEGRTARDGLGSKTWDVMRCLIR